MAAKSFSWRVIGITPAALSKFEEWGFRYKSGEGLTRAHIYPRIETVRILLAPKEPMPAKEFIETWLKRDATILCARSENREPVPEYIRIENKDGSLFSCERLLAGWRHRKEEREFLMRLSEGHSRRAPAARPAKTEGNAMIKMKKVPTPWNKGKKVIHHAVRVAGKVYPSTAKAFLALGLTKDEGANTKWHPCQKFRANLIKSKDRKLVFVPEGGKPILFELVQ